MRGAGPRVEREVGEAEHLTHGRLAPSQEGADPRQKLFEGERFDDIIVGATVQALDAIGNLIFRRKQKDGCVPFGAQASAYFEAVEPGHKDVEDDEIGLIGPYLVEARLARAR